MTHPYCNLHCHSTRSDGGLTISELVAHYDKKGVGALALTDHDILCPDDLTSYEAAAGGRVRLIRGCEVSTCYHTRDGSKSITVHVIALFYRPDAPNLQALTTYNKTLSNRDSVVLVLQKLEQWGKSIGSYEQLSRKYGHYIRKVDMARELAAKHGISIDEAYDIYLSSHGERRAYVPSHMAYPPLPVVVSAILQDGGLPILAHPLHYKLTETELEQLFEDFRTAAGENPAGVEGRYSRYAPHLQEPYYLHIRELAQRYDLLLSAGDDFHGNAQEDLHLNTAFPISIYETLKQAHEAAFQP